MKYRHTQITNWYYFVMHSSDSIETANRLFKKFYLNRGKELIGSVQIKKENVDCVLMFVRKKGMYKRVAELDFKSFYPSIILGLNLNPESDYLESYQTILQLLVKMNKENPNGKVKQFITKLSSGYLNCQEFVFIDPDMHRQVLTFGKMIMMKAVSIIDKNPDFELLKVHTDGCHVRARQLHNVRKQFNDLAESVNAEIKKEYPFLNFVVKNVYPQAHIFGVSLYHTYDPYTDTAQFKGFDKESPEDHYNSRVKNPWLFGDAEIPEDVKKRASDLIKKLNEEKQESED